MVKDPPAVQETWVRKIPWRKGMAAQSSTLAWEVPWTGEPGRLHAVHGAVNESDLTKQQRARADDRKKRVRIREEQIAS